MFKKLLIIFAVPTFFALSSCNSSQENTQQTKVNKEESTKQKTNTNQVEDNTNKNTKEANVNKSNEMNSYLENNAFIVFNNYNSSKYENYDWDNADEFDVVNYLSSNYINHKEINPSLRKRINSFIISSLIQFNENEYDTIPFQKLIIEKSKVFDYLNSLHSTFANALANKKVRFYLKDIISKDYKSNLNKNTILVINLEENDKVKVSTKEEADNLFKKLELSNMKFDNEWTKKPEYQEHSQVYEIIFKFKPSNYKKALEQINKFIKEHQNPNSTTIIPFSFDVKLQVPGWYEDNIFSDESLFTKLGASWSVSLPLNIIDIHNNQSSNSKSIEEIIFSQKDSVIDEIDRPWPKYIISALYGEITTNS